ncbi:hypothetical protein ACFL0K_02125 [Patescibacteria group bacterium]
MHYTPEQLKERLGKLPETIQKAIASVEVEQKILGIAKKHDLHIDQTGELLYETGLVMFGLTPAPNYQKNLSTHLKIDSETARSIAVDINKEVFEEIKGALVEVVFFCNS